MRLLVVAFLLFSLPSPTTPNQQKSKSDEERNVATPTANQVTPVTVVVNQPPPQPQKETAETKTRGADNIFWPPIWSNWALVAIAAYAAKVGLKNINHLITAERAWVFADIRNVMGRTISGDSKTMIDIAVECRNVGKSPAWITEVRARFEVFQEPLPKEPRLETADIIHAEPYPIAPGDKPFSTGGHPLEVLGVQGLDFSGEMFIVYGVVVYRDSFSENRRTTFGYRLLPGTDARFKRLSGYPKYNETS